MRGPGAVRARPARAPFAACDLDDAPAMTARVDPMAAVQDLVLVAPVGIMDHVAHRMHRRRAGGGSAPASTSG